MSVIKNEIKNNFNLIRDEYRSIFLRKYAFSACSQVEIAKRRSDGFYDDSVFEISKLLFKNSFATQDQIARYLDIENDIEFDKYLDFLEKNKIVNYFVLSEFEENSALKEDDVLKIYTLDFGGLYLLALEGENTLNWKFTQYLVGTKLIKKGLILTELYISLLKRFRNTDVNIKNYKQFTEMRVSNKRVMSDFEFYIQKGAKRENILGLIVDQDYCDFYLPETLEDLDLIFKKTNVYEKYYPQGQEDIPQIMCIIPTSEDKNLIKSISNLFGRKTEFRGSELSIVCYDDIIDTNSNKIKTYTIRTEEVENKETIVKIGGTTKNIFN